MRNETHMQRMLRLSRENAQYGGFFMWIIQERGVGRKEFDKRKVKE